MGKHWKIMENLSRRRHYVSELAEVLNKNVPEASAALKELQEMRLVEFEPGGRRKYFYLSNKGRDMFSSLTKATQPKEKTELVKKNADAKEIDFYLNMIENPPSIHAMKMASEEFMRLSGEYIVVNHEWVLPFLEEKLLDPQYETIHLNLIYSLKQIVQNTYDKECLQQIKSKFKNLLKELAENMTLEKSNEKSTIRLCTIETLLDIMEYEEGFKELIKLYEKGIRNKSKLIENIRLTILARYPDRVYEVRKALFEVLSDPREDIIKRVKNQIRELRRPVKDKIMMSKYTVEQ